MPYTMQSHPHWAQVAVRTCRVLAYAASTVAGLAVFIFSTPALASNPAVYVIAGSMMLFGLICLVGTLMLNYIVEWISLFFLCAGLSYYVASVWITVFGAPSKIAGTSALTMLVLFLAIRAIDLTVYWLKNVRVAQMAKDLGNAS